MQVLDAGHRDREETEIERRAGESQGFPKPPSVLAH